MCRNNVTSVIPYEKRNCCIYPPKMDGMDVEWKQSEDIGRDKRKGNE